MDHTQLQAIMSQERIYMSESNREHFDIEAWDHIEQLKAFPDDAVAIHESLMHRVHLHKTRNMYLVPPMLFPRANESDVDHMKREFSVWGLEKVPIGYKPAGTPENGSGRKESAQINEIQQSQEELFKCPELNTRNTLPD